MVVAVHVASVARTAVRACDTELSGWHPVTLAGLVGQTALDRAGITGNELDEVVVGCSDPVGANGADVARAVVLAAGWATTTGGHVIDRGETSGAAAIQTAAATIALGEAETVLVIGLGLNSVVPPGAAALNRTYGAPWIGVAERFTERGGLLPAPRLAERAAEAVGIMREHTDTAADRSRNRRLADGHNPAIVAVAAKTRRSSRQTKTPATHNRGRQALSRTDPITPTAQLTSVATGSAAVNRSGRDDFVMSDTIRTWENIANLPPLFNEDGLLTSATFAPPADAVSAVLLQAPARPLAELKGTGRAAGDPFDSTGNVSQAVRRALREASIGLDDINEIALVECDAAMLLLTARALGVDPERMNPNGGAIATGNAGAAEELRLITDGLTGSGYLLTLSVGPTGSAAAVWLRR